VSGGAGGGFGGFAGPPGESGASGLPGAAADGGGGGIPSGFGALGAGSGDASQITSWVEGHFKSETVGGTTIYVLSSPTVGSAGSAGARTAPPGPGTGAPAGTPPAEAGFQPPQ